METISVTNLPRMMKFKKPWDVLKAYPEMTWGVIKTLYDENVQLKEEIRLSKNDLVLPITGRELTLTEKEVVGTLKSYLNDCDGDALAGICEYSFGGQMTTDGEVFTLYPNENYYGAFDYLTEVPKQK